jgi:hypothetical protein
VGIEDRDSYRADPPRGVQSSASPRPDDSRGAPWWVWFIGAFTIGGGAATDTDADGIHDDSLTAATAGVYWPNRTGRMLPR